jgi:TRAP-type C4-dicarboxylate transport system substrate-binding protein
MTHRERGALAFAFAFSFSPSFAHADPTVIRFASPAPEGTSWAREGHAFARAVDQQTNGAIKIKFFLGGITGDEAQTIERIRRGQVDEIAAAEICTRLAPSMRVLRVLGLFQNRDESAYVSGRLKAVFDEEFRRSGFVNLGELGVGPDVIFSRAPMKSLADLKTTPLWIWDLDDVYRTQLVEMGLHPVPTPIDRAAVAFDEHKLDGFLSVPAAALAFQWSAQVRDFTDLHVGFLRGCFIISARTWDSMSTENQSTLKVAHAKLLARLEDVGRHQDDQLLGGLFERQGLKRVQTSEALRADFFDAAQKAREKLGEKLVAPALLNQVLAMLADYRAEHRPASSPRP